MQYILDTNVLRNLVAGKEYNDILNEITKFKTTKKSKSFSFLFSNAVCIELLNHLNDNGNAKIECLKALIFKVRLCGDFTTIGRVKGIIIPEFNELLSLYFFGKSSTHFILNSNLLSLSHDISLKSASGDILNFKKQIDEVIQYKSSELQNLLNNIENHYLNNFSETHDWSIFKENEKLKKEFQTLLKKKVFHKLFSLSLIKMTFEKESKIDLSIEEFQRFNSDFCLALDFFIMNIWKKFIDIEKIEYFSNPSTDPKKRWNSFYDTQIIMACEFENCKGRETKLVTTEKRILEHFKKHKKEEWCMSYEEFNKKIIN